jgi:hypothetical protein
MFTNLKTWADIAKGVRVDSDTLSCANFDAWPDVDGKTCGNCQALAPWC